MHDCSRVASKAFRIFPLARAIAALLRAPCKPRLLGKRSRLCHKLFVNEICT
jgi:hypothetical protein